LYITTPSTKLQQSSLSLHSNQDSLFNADVTLKGQTELDPIPSEEQKKTDIIEEWPHVLISYGHNKQPNAENIHGNNHQEEKLLPESTSIMMVGNESGIECVTY
jgi:hypothetical protein